MVNFPSFMVNCSPFMVVFHHNYMDEPLGKSMKIISSKSRQCEASGTPRVESRTTSTLGTDQTKWRGENRAFRWNTSSANKESLYWCTLCYLDMEEIEEMENHHIGGVYFPTQKTGLSSVARYQKPKFLPKWFFVHCRGQVPQRGMVALNVHSSSHPWGKKHLRPFMAKHWNMKLSKNGGTHGCP